MVAEFDYTILIVDDAPDDRVIYHRYLSKDNRYTYQIIEAESVSEALELYDRNLPDLVVLDYHLPNDDGTVFLREWQRRYGKTLAPVVMLTGYENPTAAVEAMKLGIQDYWIKSQLTADFFCQGVRTILEQIQLKRQLLFQQEQQRLANSIALRIRQSLQLQDVLQNTVEEVRQLLQADRTLIYQFTPDMKGIVRNESVLPQWTACLNAQIEETCFLEYGTDKYQQNWLWAVSDIDKADLTDCHRELLQRFQVKANLVVPILLVVQSNDPDRESASQQKLWGFLIAHQCDRPRHWQNREISLLSQLTVQLAIAIQQSEMYERVQAQLYARVEAQLQERQRVAAEFRTLVESASDIIFRIDTDLRYLYINPAIERIVPQAAKDWIGKTPEELGIDQQMIALWRELLNPIIVSRSEETIEHPFPLSNSQTICQTRIVPELNQEGTVQSFLCIARNITTRKKMEQELQLLNQELETRVEQRTAELQESQQFIQSVTDSIPNILYIYDLEETRAIYTNREVANTLGYSPEQISAMGSSVFPKILHPDDLANAVTQIQSLRRMGDGERQVFEYRLKDVNGRWCWFLSHNTPFRRSEDGLVKQIIGISQDISERKQMEEQLRRSETQLKMAQRIAGLGSWEFDLQTGEVTWSEEVFRNFKLNPEDGTPTYEELQQLLHPDDRDRYNLLMQRAIEQGQPYSIEFRLYCLDGSLRYLQTRTEAVCNENGQVVRLMGTTLDITERKQAEEQLQKVNERLTLTNAELYRATRLKDEFLANMSHELRTPLNAILGMSQGLQDQILGALNDRQKSAIDSIERSGQHLLALINDILDLAKVESGKLELQLAPVAIAYICTSSLSFVQQQAIAKNIQLSIEAPFGLPDIVADELRIRQVLINLLSNAVKFTPNGGSVKLSVGQEQSQNQNFLCFSVIDTGIGIAEEDVAKLFQPFTQIDSRLNRQHPGTGLGLSLVRRLVQLHQGNITVTSELGQGSCFTVCLPYRVIVPQAIAQPVKPKSTLNPFPQEMPNQEQSLQVTTSFEQLTIPVTYPGKATSNALILLVEDHEVSALSISSYLEGRGYRWLWATNGQQAITLATTQHPDLILMDIQMPEMDGLEAISHIRANPRLVQTPIIAVTALAMPGDQEKCLKAGADYYITKPIKLKQLITIIQKLLLKGTNQA